MILEGVNFNEEEVSRMSREEFRDRHMDLFWKERDEATRTKMLDEAYDRIVKPPKAKKKSDK